MRLFPVAGLAQRSKARRLHYGWVIAAASFLVVFNYGIFYSYGVFFKPLIAEFGWSRAQTSLAFSLYLLTYCLAAIVMGWLSDRWGPRLPVFLAAVLIGGGFVALTGTSALWMLYLFFGLVAALGHGASYVVPVSTTVRWFDQRQGTAVGMVTAGMGAGTLLFPPLANWLITAFGWRQAFLVVGLMAFAYNALASLLLRRRRAPQGADSAATPPPGEGVSTDTPGAYTLKEALRTYSFWSIYAAIMLGFASYTLVLVHLVPFATDRGVTPGVAAGALSAIGVGALLGRIALGMLSDRIGKEWTLRLAYSVNALAMTGLLAGAGSGLLYAVGFAVGFCGIGGSVVVGPLFGQFFGQRNLGNIMGVFMTCGGIAGFMGPYAAGYLFDVTGRYFLSFVMAAGIAWGGAVLTFFSRPPRVSQEQIQAPTP